MVRGEGPETPGPMPDPEPTSSCCLPGGTGVYKTRAAWARERLTRRTAWADRMGEDSCVRLSRGHDKGQSMRRLGATLALTAVVLVVCLRRADAYLDAGTGSYVIQLLVAGFFGFLFALKVFWKRIRAFLSRLFSRRTDNEGSDT